MAFVRIGHGTTWYIARSTRRRLSPDWLSVGPILAADWSDRFLALAAIAIVVFLSDGRSHGPVPQLAWGPTDREILCAVIGSWTGTMVLGTAVVFALDRQSYLSRNEALLWFVGTVFLLATGRLSICGIQHFRRARGIGTRTFAVVGINKLGFQLARNIRRSPALGLRLAGFFDDRKRDRLPRLADVTWAAGWARSTELVKGARRGEIENDLYHLSHAAEERTKRVLTRLADSDLPQCISCPISSSSSCAPRLDEFGGLPPSAFDNPVLRRRRHWSSGSGPIWC